jgi:adenosine deaminase/aminodeoxyfutalosine deaminase
MGEFHRNLAKAELHVHLEGSVEPETFLELHPELSRQEVLEHYSFEDFRGFIRAYTWVALRLKTPQDYALITRRLLERLAAENVRYVEINLSVGVMLYLDLDPAPLFDAAEREAAASPVRVRWIFDAVRQFGPEKAQAVAELAAARVPRGVVGFGIGGDESRGPAEWFGEVFAFARRSGLHLAPHAGETVGPESVWAALEMGAERIGHGIRAIDDPALVRHLRDHGIPLEISISSNLATGAVGALDDHPVRKLFEAGVPLTLNTDDPAMFRTTLSREYEIAEDAFGFSHAELEELAGNGFRFAFGLE